MSIPIVCILELLCFALTRLADNLVVIPLAADLCPIAHSFCIDGLSGRSRASWGCARRRGLTLTPTGWHIQGRRVLASHRSQAVSRIDCHFEEIALWGVLDPERAIFGLGSIWMYERMCTHTKVLGFGLFCVPSRIELDVK